MAAVDDQSARAPAVLPEIADRQARGVARELAAVWAALRRHCDRRLGVTPGVLLDARGFRSLAAEVAAGLARYPGMTPDPQDVADYLKLLDLCWGTRFGTGEDGSDE